MHEGLWMGLLAFFILVWPRLYLWMETREYESKMAQWQRVCPTCGYLHDERWPHKRCGKCSPDHPDPDD